MKGVGEAERWSVGEQFQALRSFSCKVQANRALRTVSRPKYISPITHTLGVIANFTLNAGENIIVMVSDSSYIVDVHTHIYPPSYIELLKSRTTVPLIRQGQDEHTLRLIILPGEDDDTSKPPEARGRAIGPDFWDIDRKVKFMKDHGIDVSIISLANPWLDWLPPDMAGAATRTINNELNQICQIDKSGSLYSFAALPLSADIDTIVSEIRHVSQLSHIRGVIMGTSGLGKGLDDPALEPVWGALEETNTLVFLHPHYGLPSEVYGPRAHEYGHVLPLALGFPLETTIAVTRMFLSRVWDRFPRLDVLLAHSGGTLPFLAGRIESCLAHDAHLMEQGKLANRRLLWDVLGKNIYLDAVIYSAIGLKAAVESSGWDRVMFGTDHPFFPPLEKSQNEWLSVTLNTAAVHAASQSVDDAESRRAAVLGGNAVLKFGLRRQ